MKATSKVNTLHDISGQMSKLHHLRSNSVRLHQFKKPQLLPTYKIKTLNNQIKRSVVEQMFSILSHLCDSQSFNMDLLYWQLIFIFSLFLLAVCGSFWPLVALKLKQKEGKVVKITRFSNTFKDCSIHIELKICLKKFQF